MDSVYSLPNSPNRRCVDRFSILDDILEDEDGQVSLWALFCVILEKPATNGVQVADIIDTILCTLHGDSGVAGDYGALKTAIDSAGPAFFRNVWPIIIKLSLRLPQCFPDGGIKILKAGDALRLGREQAACLVAHQFLGTLYEPPWRDGFYDFTIWYNSAQRHPKAIDMYFAALFSYFAHFDQNSLDDVSTVDFSLHSLATVPLIPSNWNDIPLTTAAIVHVNMYSTQQQELSTQGLSGAVVVSANKDVGFGQSATQEEIYTANCPESCIEVLITPTLGPDQVLVVCGARPMLRIDGQRRDLYWSELLEPRGGRMLIMDALELDEDSGNDGLPDLKAENMRREIEKAYVAFSSWKCDAAEGVEDAVWVGLWGCGAFNGDPGIKMTLLWIAASLAGKKLNILIDEHQKEFGQHFARFLKEVKAISAQELSDRVARVPRGQSGSERIDFLMGRIK